jgi:hypothetical protein
VGGQIAMSRLLIPSVKPSTQNVRFGLYRISDLKIDNKGVEDTYLLESTVNGVQGRFLSRWITLAS